MKLPTLAKFKHRSVKQRFRVFVAWLRAQPSDTPYQFRSCSDCALARFGRAITKRPCVAGVDFAVRKKPRKGEHFEDTEYANGWVTVIPPKTSVAPVINSITYGQLLSRLA